MRMSIQELNWLKMIEEFINYTKLADNKVIDAFSSLDKELHDAQRLFSHVLNAQHIWVKRIAGEKSIFGIWQEHKKNDFATISKENFEMIDSCLQNIPLETLAVYHDSKGNEYKHAVSTMFMQMLNHSTYHRGQIVSLLKVEGIVPPATDYILFKRNNLL